MEMTVWFFNYLFVLITSMQCKGAVSENSAIWIKEKPLKTLKQGACQLKISK